MGNSRVIIISHRGNISGPSPKFENNPKFVTEAIRAGYDCEVDVWYENDRLYLGHDKPQYEISLKFLKNDKFWCHAKNLPSLEFMIKNDIHCFWHQEDNYTLTSRGFIWAYPGMPLVKDSICVMPEKAKWDTFNNCSGICTDYPNRYRRITDEL